MPLDSMPLLGQRAVITGAARGIGQSIASRLADAGADVVLIDMLDLDDTMSVVMETGRAALSIRVDLTDREQVDRTCQRLLDDEQSIDVLVCNAGVVSTSRTEQTSDAEWDRVLETNLTSAFRICRWLWPALIAAEGRIVFIGSRAARTGGNNAGPAYVASKGAVHSLVIALANDGAGSGIRVNGVAPGPTATSMTRLPSYENATNATPLGRMGDPSEIADAVLYLASPASSFVTGTVLNVSGGALMG